MENLEYAVIGALLIKPELIRDLSKTLTPDDFSVRACGDVFDLALDCDSCGKPFDAAIAAHDLERTMENPRQFIAELIDACPTTANALHHASMLRKQARAARMREAVSNSLLEDDPDKLASDLMDIARKGMAEAEDVGTVVVSETAGEFLDSLGKPVGEGRIETGFQKLDYLLKGIDPGQLILLGARPSVGKSAFGLSLALNAAVRKKRVLFCSLEMTREEIMGRAVSRLGRVPMDSISAHKLTDEEWRRANDAGEVMSRLPLIICDTGNLTIGKVRTLARKTEPDIIIIDYIGLMTAERKSDNRNLELGQISRGLKQLAMELNKPIVALAQLNRGADDLQKPELRSLRDSGELEQDANKVVFLWNVEPMTGVIGAYVAKNRSGRTGTVQYQFNGDFMTFTELKEEYVPPKKSKGDVPF